MRKSVLFVAAVALSVVMVPQTQAAPAKHKARHAAHATRVAQQPAKPAKDPMCNNPYNKQNMNWQEHYHCFGH